MQPAISIKDDSFNPDFSQKYILSILISNQSLSYTILDSRKNKYLILQSFNFPQKNGRSLLLNDIRKVISDDDTFKLSFKKVRAAIVSEKSSLIPSDLTNKDTVGEMLELTNKITSGETTKSDEIDQKSLKNIYVLSKDIKNYLEEQFPGIELFHGNTPILKSLFENKKLKKTAVYAHIRPNFADFFAFRDKKLIFSNSFFYKSTEDFLYFTLLVYEQMELDPEKIGLILVGEIEKKSALYKAAEKYIRNIEFGERPNSVNYSYKFSFLPAHHFYQLLSMNLCE